MADVSLSTLTPATPATASTAGVAIADGTAADTLPFANLLTALADPTATGAASVPATSVALMPLPPAVLPIVSPDPKPAAQPSDAPAIEGAESATDTDAADGDPKLPALAPDLSAFIASIVPPPQIAAIPVAALSKDAGAISASIAAPRAAIAMASFDGGPPAPESMLRTPVASAPEGAARPAADTLPADVTTPIAPERMAQAFAAIRAMAASTPARVEAPAPAATAVTQNDTPVAAMPSISATAATSASDDAAGSRAPAVPAPTTPSSPAPGSPTIAAPMATAQQSADPVEVTVPDTDIAARVPDAVVAPALMPGRRTAERAVTPAGPVTAAASNEAPHLAPVRTRKVQDTIRVGDMRIDTAPARIDAPSIASVLATSTPDDPVARQLSIAQDGQWLDSLAKDIASAGNTNGQLNFRLDPDHLGSLTVQIAQGSDGASIRLTASSDAARTILADAQPRLVAEARAQGLNLRDATVDTRTAAPTPASSTNASFGGNAGGGRSDQGGVSAQLQQQSQQQGGSRQRAPDQPRQSNPAPRMPTPTRSGADLYA